MKSQNHVAQRVAVSVHRGVSRRTLLRRFARSALGAGAVIAAPDVLLGRRNDADATHCPSPNGTQSFGTGDDCAPTPSCGQSNCNGYSCAGSARRRCNAWDRLGPNSEYCWCSPEGCTDGRYGYYICCDCWLDPPSKTTNCETGTDPCICKQRQFITTC